VGRLTKKEEFLRASHEKRSEIINKRLEGVSDEEKDILLRTAMAQFAAMDDSPESFAYFYEVIHGRPMPLHAYEEWVIPMYDAYRNGKGIVIEAYRGSFKTTTITITFTAYRIGKSPEESNVLVQVGDDIAQDNSQAIADIIANNPGWRMVFPNVVPDREKGWGAGGYEVKLLNVPYGMWRERNSSRKDPTLVAVGYKSRELIGKHPTGIFIVDDIHDENNTSSVAELNYVQKILTGTIYPAPMEGCWRIFIGTPWRDNDCLHYTASTGEYEHVKTPVYRDAEPDEADSTIVELDGKNVKLSCPLTFSADVIKSKRRLSGAVEFARMYLLDLTASANRVFKYMTYPSSEFSPKWVMCGGVDYASNRDAAKNAQGKGDYFAMAYLAKIPSGGAVVVDGILTHCTQADGEGYVMRAQEIFPLWITTVVEAVGKGDDFFQVLQRHPTLKIMPMQPGRRSKSDRLEKSLSPWLEGGVIRISDAQTPFLNELRRELDAWPFVDHDDALDALYYATKGMPDVFALPETDEDGEPIYAKRKQKKENPFNALGRQ
jgi:hypothetical protein